MYGYGKAFGQSALTGHRALNWRKIGSIINALVELYQERFGEATRIAIQGIVFYGTIPKSGHQLNKRGTSRAKALHCQLL